MATIEKPKYRQISLDIARKIINGDIKEGEKLYGRSELAALYNVSPETIRRAITVLKDMGVVSVLHGSGIIIKSRDLAYKYVDRFNETESLEQLQKKLEKLIKIKKRLDDDLSSIIDRIIDYTVSLKNINPFNPFEIEIKSNTKAIGKTLSELNFWQNTGGTIIGIRRGDKIILSPGPYAEIKFGDILVIVGDGDVPMKTKHFLYND
ncbi:TrkA C-terminal domain-containing protein [Thermoanaerobacterium sp. RBIITD]|uniref:TrkA C-terminal domain-containing protein n=1 Tax=Thermoanaerobacterium sp. RBIITD TaxID=1550240 RepID=UPI000BB941F9|nr:TrkA C-terminal domain-containing protein [Thermoanaerobacterium sp. RBIITD]SNX53168.1 regulatory protein, gntR family [Thermoanaerobacterium sp. RBIITD]